MKSLLIFLVLFSCKSFAVPLNENKLEGEWVSINTYGKLKGRTESRLLFSTNKIFYRIDDLELTCPKEHFRIIDGIFHFRCLNDEWERVRFALSGFGGGKYASLFGFEFWVGGMPEHPESIHGGTPVSFKLASGL
ncbi:hypothetical protein OAG1_17560 [Agarivorans sp. OAG1]|uniref:hypothetical protein n=1 Tax=Agarivorans sp. OAG1 TaxID=3082387 RepID=UPI002B28C102|nr:hypothetical protein OAG1_17560 [Agarivorans sp. OAG1]